MTFINSGTNPNNGLSNYQAQFKVVAFNPLTTSYLHMSGSGETANRDYAWVGTRNQFDNISKKLEADYELQSALEKKSDQIVGASDAG